MTFSEDFELSSVSGKIQRRQTDRFGPLADLVGIWRGTGFNQIWRPFHRGPSDPPTQDRFLELNEYIEELQFHVIPGDIPNRGLLQEDINLAGLTYLQQIQDANVLQNNRHVGIHAETGVWINIPQTTNPADPPTISRMANIPHGTSFVAQGTAATVNGPPAFPPVSITPFRIGQPASLVQFPESNLSTPSQFRTPSGDIPHVTQPMVDNPNIVLAQGISGKSIMSTTILTISTTDLKPPFSGGGISNIAFLQGTAAPNAQAAQVDATFWIEKIKEPDGNTGLQLQYSQKVLLNFNGLSWPHVSVATLSKEK
ncbi:MAG: heme-binding protein [Nitrosotalea sp.]